MAAFCLGYADALRGLSGQWCPFPTMTVEWSDWNRGHGIGCTILTALQANA